MDKTIFSIIKATLMDKIKRLEHEHELTYIDDFEGQTSYTLLFKRNQYTLTPNKPQLVSIKLHDDLTIDVNEIQI